MNRRGRCTAGLLLTVLATGCAGGSEPGSKTEAPSSPPPPSVSAAAPPPAAPRVGSCHALDLTDATDPVDSTTPVPCGGPHTSVTIKVGNLAPVRDGHLLAVDSATMRRQLADRCPAVLGDVVGGDRATRRLSRLEVVWFGPSLEQSDAGANWFRCDVVGLRSTGSLLPLPRSVRGVLDRPGALDRFGTCGTTAPGRKGFTRVACSERHAWRAVDVVGIAPGARYLSRVAAAAGDARCKEIAAGRAGDSLKFSWSFEWPTRTQWKTGQRYGYCWVPRS